MSIVISTSAPTDIEYTIEISFLRMIGHNDCKVCQIILVNRDSGILYSSPGKAYADATYIADYYKSAIEREESYMMHAEEIVISVVMEVKNSFQRFTETIVVRNDDATNVR